MLESDKMVLKGAQIKMHTLNSLLHWLKVPSLASCLNMEKLLTMPACATEKGKAGINACPQAHAGDGLLFFRKKVPVKDLFF